MSESSRNFVSLIPTWVAATQNVEIPAQPDEEELDRCVVELRGRLRDETWQAFNLESDDQGLAVLSRLCFELSKPFCVGDSRRMIYAETAAAVEQARARFIKKWRLACPPVAASIEEAGEELFTFLKFPRSQWKALRTTNALERINEEFRRRTKTQASLPSESAVLLLLFGPLRSGQIRLRAIDGCHQMKVAA